MPLGLHEIRARAAGFAQEWADATEERAEAQSFWNEFFEVFGVKRRRVAVFERAVERLGKDAKGRIDVFWPGQLIAEHKSGGRNLDDAFKQAMDYLLSASIKEEEQPRYVIVSDFQKMRLYDLDVNANDFLEFPLNDLPKHVKKLGFIAGRHEVVFKDEDPINVKAANKVGQLHKALADSGFNGHPLEVLLVRLVFCFFADDTRIFENDTFRLYLTSHTREDGTDVGAHLNLLFQVLNSPKKKRQSNLDDDLKELPCIDGHLFEEKIDVPIFTSEMRTLLLDCASFDWSLVSPAIFGSMFQSVMDEKVRHDLGAHYTSEKNILKVIGPLFLDDLRTELDEAGRNKRKLETLHDKLGKLKFLDPACGCGNFLVVTYRELRRMEIELLKRLYVREDDNATQSTMLNMGVLSRIDVDCMYGIEIEEFPARIAELALWLTDHQMNTELGDVFGVYYARLPLSKRPNIHQDNALKLDWGSVVPKEQLSYIFGNPPFIGSKIMSDEQRVELATISEGVNNAGVLDYVTGWYLKAAKYIHVTNIEVAFVSTNSITQGEQVAILWNELLGRYGVSIKFAHRTFKWTNEARGKAAVFCVIIGFSFVNKTPKTIFEYDDVRSEPHRIVAKNINPYLVDAANVLIASRSKPICDVPLIKFGNQPIDGGFLTKFSTAEKEQFITEEPGAVKYFLRFVGSEEFINGIERWCLWLQDADPSELRKMPRLTRQIEEVKRFRLLSKRADTRKLADTPTLFAFISHPKSSYIIIPSVSSESRLYVPMGFMPPSIIASNLCLIVPDATLYHFGILESEMHMAWMRTVCGRLKSDYRYSNSIVYNNFPWPQEVTDKDKENVEKASQHILDVRNEFPTSTLADLYDPNTMPPKLLKAHQELDKAVDKCYGKKGFATEAERLEFLFGMYKELSEKQMIMEHLGEGKKRRGRKSA
jgi:hypothetical protein